jgi:hypothetical protein
LVSGAGESAMDVALYVMALKEAQLEGDVNVRILKTAMETQEALVKDLLQSMGIGTYIDTHE